MVLKEKINLTEETIMTIAFFDVDNQYDFIDRDGRLAVPNAEEIVPNLFALTLTAQEKGIPIFGTVDNHPTNDKEFETYPPHCVTDTEGQRKIVETLLDETMFVPNEPGALTDEELKETLEIQQVILEKQTYDIWDIDDGQPVNLNRLLGEKHVDTVVVYGVAGDICVNAAVEGFIARNYNVYVVEDAIQFLTTGEDEVKMKNKWNDLGVKFINTNLLTL